MAVWSQVVEGDGEPEVATLSFVDDRLFGARTRASAERAKARSDQFGQAYMFQCEVDKCRVAFSSECGEGLSLAQSLGYTGGTQLSILGIVIPIHLGDTPMLKKFKLQVAYCDQSLVLLSHWNPKWR